MNKIQTYIDKCYSYISECKKEIDKYDIISFDCWDTLIVRPFHDPYVIQKYINPQYYNYRHKNLKHCGYDIDQSIELQLCQPRTDIYELYKYAKLKNKHIIVVSDFYFDKHFINKLLAKCNYDIDIDNINISHDFKDNKLNTLYKKIVDKYKTNSILHIGDNLLADYQQPFKFNIKSFYIPQIHHTFKQIFNVNNIDCNNVVISSFIGRLANNLLKYNNIHAQLGALFAFIPEALLNYSLTVCKHNNTKSMIFVGRDMYIPYHHFINNFVNGEDYIVQFIDTQNRKIIDDIYPIDNSIICQCSTTRNSIQNIIKQKYNKTFKYAILQSGVARSDTLVPHIPTLYFRHITEAALRAPYIINDNKRCDFTNLKQKEEYIPRIQAECEFNYMKNINYTSDDIICIFKFIQNNLDINKILQVFTYYRCD